MLIGGAIAAGLAVFRDRGRQGTAAEAPPRSIAVLPFVDLSSAGDSAYFSDGLAEEVLNLLSQAPELRVIARTSSFSFRDRDADIATACHPIADAQDVRNPNVVKVVLDTSGRALYFSRAAIPYARDAYAGGIKNVPRGLPVYRHLSIYAYRCAFLRAYSALEPAPLERFEALEQLRVLWHGFRIAVRVSAQAPAAGVDTADDLARVRAQLGANR